jgi:hypothetical protein
MLNPVPTQKWQIAPEFKAGVGFEPEEYMEYFEDSNLPPNTDIGSRTLFLGRHMEQPLPVAQNLYQGRPVAEE